MFYLFQPVDFEWDDAKAALNEAKHGVSFRFALRVFLDERRLQFLDERRDYGETRWQVIGMVESFCLHVTFTARGDAARIISARPAHTKERKKYGNRSRLG